MISFDGFHMEEGTPIYQQILLFLKRSAVSGEIQDGDELPSRRALSALLGVNPNTVQKAYRQLEEEGLIRSHTGAKSCMVLDDEQTTRIRAELLENDAKSVVQAMKQMGLSKPEALRLIETFWD
ncbi:MAG TPA: GntR family transcriptional regulator [Candidatus Agathobaculum intestinipullorum]|nr:GntR family transcriptional regulator [Candidatus Agathobaculum intestinipullorum]